MTALAASLLMASPLAAEVVGEVGVDWVGNDIVIEAIPDPKVEGVTCHVAYFDRSVLDRLSQGNWFEDPSYSALDCRQTGPITVGDIDRGKDGESIFSERTSLIFKSLRVTRIFDAKNNTLVYLAHASELTQGSGKMSISTVPLYESAK
ncbi:MAG: CreA family protein [Rhodobacteraceae bacterium]|nr:CreA family protein [Paracoccaceae bacterium]